MTPSPVLETYWRFAVERQEIYFNRLVDPCGPWTSDPILLKYRFTNAYRASDRVSQYLIREVQYRPDRSQDPRELFFRTLLFKVFNRIDTWESIERKVGPIKWSEIDINSINCLLDDLIGNGRRIYSAAYIMPAPNLGHMRKHSNHLALINSMMKDNLPDRVRQAPSLRSVYELLLQYPGIGPFLAFQYTIDLNYSTLLDFNEDELVVAGPGALDGIAKCFEDREGKTAEAIIYMVTDDQERAFSRLGLNFQTLYGRRLQPVDCQNLFCEISKYARVAHPDAKGISGRSRIKQSYRLNNHALPVPFFPPRWKLNMEFASNSPVPDRYAAGLLI